MSNPEDKKPLGRILLQQKLVSPAELEQLLEKQRRSPGMRLASAAAVSGKLSDLDVLRALSDQLGVPAIDLSQVVIPLANLKLVPHDVARQSSILPFSVREDEMWLAMADPHDRRIIDEIEFVTGKVVSPYVALHEHLGRVIDEAYAGLERGDAYYVGPNAPEEYLAQLGIARGPEGTRGRGTDAPRSGGAGRPPTAALDERLGRRGPTRHEAPPDETDVSTLFDEGPGPPAELAARRQLASPRSPTNAREPAHAPHRARSRPADLASLDPAFDSRVGPLPAGDARRSGVEREARTVLVVDDEEDIRRLVRRVLVERGYRVVEAGRGTEALRAIREHTLDCILLDAMLPEIHGFDICRRVKASAKYGHIPIVMVSAVYRGWRFAEDLREAYGVTAFLEKPFKVADVVSAVERAIEGKTDEPSDVEEQMSPEARAALARGMAAYHRGDVDAAVADLRQAVDIEPGSFQLHYHLGLLYGRRDELFEAIRELEAALVVSSRNFSALKNLAVLYQRAGFKHKAVESWERALRAAPDEETRRTIREHLVSLL